MRGNGFRRWMVIVALALAGVAGVSGDEVTDLEARLKNQEAEVKATQVELAKARAAAKAANAFRVPLANTQFAIPKLAKAPVIDGVVDEKEWAGAIEVPLTTGIYGMMERHSSVFYIGWDAENLYFAQRLKLRPGEKLLRLNREPLHDNVQPHENAVEVYVDRRSTGSHPSGCRWQFMGNAVGNQWDREDQYEIGQNFVGWDGEWSYKQRLTPDGQYWEAEIAMPRKTVYQEQPLKDGDVWWIGIATDLHRPWCFSGFYGWNIPATFRDSTPEIRLSEPQESLVVHGIAGDLAVRNTTGKPLQLEVVAQLLGRKLKPDDTLVFEKKWPLTVAPGETGKLAIREPVKDAADGQNYKLSIQVRQGNNSLYTWAYPIRYNMPENKEGLDFQPEAAPFVLQTFYNPLSNYLRVVVDKYDFPQAAQVAKARFSVTAADGGKALASGELSSFTYEKGETRVPTPADLAPGSYTCTAELVDAVGKVLSTHTATFERRDPADFPWLNNTIGEDDVVVPPFEPLDVQGSTIGAFEKTIVTDGSGLPSAITAAGVDLLAGPIQWQVKGQAAAPAGPAAKLVSGSRTHADYEGATTGPLAVKTSVHWEYDATAKVTAVLAPGSYDSIDLVIPVREEAATYYMVNGINMRLSNKAGLLPDKPKTGVLWKSTEMPYQKMTVGSFVPIIWLGNLHSGLTWFADSDQGWFPGDVAPAAEIVRPGNGTVEIRLHIAPGPVEFTEPRTIEFGLNVNPVRAPSDYTSSICTFGYLQETGRWDPKKSRSKVFARRYPDDIEKSRHYIEVAHKYGEIYAPYTEMSPKDLWDDEWSYFLEEWRSTDQGGQVVHCDSSNDCLLYWTKKWIDDAGLDGYYFDNVFNRLNYNTHAGTAYELPDGRIQPGYTLWGMRAHIKRIRTIFSLTRPRFSICIHNTRYQFAPIMGFSDLAMGGEMATPRGDNPGAGDFMDMYPRDFMDVMYNEPLWGYKLSHLYHFRSNTYVNDLGEPDVEAALKVHRGAMATMLVHGVEFFQGINYQPYLANQWRLLKALPGGKPEFIPSWNANGLFELKTPAKYADVAVYRKQDMLLVIVANYDSHRQRVLVKLDFPKLIDLPQPGYRRSIIDFETMAYKQGLVIEPIPESKERLPRLGDPVHGHPTLLQSNTLDVRVEPHDFRAVLFINLPPAKGAGF